MNKLATYIPALRSRKLLIVVVLAVVIAAGSVLIFGRFSTKAVATDLSVDTQKTQQPAAALTVAVATATHAQWPATLEASGTIAPWQEAVIGAQISGLRLAEIRVNVGDQVKRGQTLAIFDADLLLADEARLKASWQQAEANRQRAIQLKDSGGMSDQEILQYITQAEVAKAQLQSVQLQLRYAEVVAPDDGVISARSATLGAVSNTGQELFRMIRKNRLEWRGELSAAQLGQAKPGQEIGLALPDGSLATARVRKTAPSLDRQTRLGIVYADVDSGSAARAGMYVKGSIVLAQSPAIIVPAASVVIRDGRSYVPKMAEADRVALQVVTVGRRQGDFVEIASGIDVGDRVVAQGAGFLNDGDKVRVIVTAEKE